MLPDPPVFKKGPEFRDFLYKKRTTCISLYLSLALLALLALNSPARWRLAVLNAERACYLAPTLDAKLSRTRKALLNSLIDAYAAS